jgi:hypothetical protein
VEHLPPLQAWFMGQSFSVMQPQMLDDRHAEPYGEPAQSVDAVLVVQPQVPSVVLQDLPSAAPMQSMFVAQPHRPELRHPVPAMPFCGVVQSTQNCPDAPQVFGVLSGAH